VLRSPTFSAHTDSVSLGFDVTVDPGEILQVCMCRSRLQSILPQVVHILGIFRFESKYSNVFFFRINFRYAHVVGHPKRMKVLW